MYVVLGIHDCHDCGAAVMVDGRIVAAAQEERFSGLKHDCGVPQQAIAYVLEQAGVTNADVDEVALSSDKINPVMVAIKRNANFSVQNWVEEQRLFWYPRLYEGKDPNYYGLFKKREGFSYEDTYNIEELSMEYKNQYFMDEFVGIRKNTLSRLLNIPIEKFRTVSHEDCHAFYAYFAGPVRENALVITAEGHGDYSNATVSTFDLESGRKEIACNNENMIGTIYKYITLILGMKPTQHEYKVMGMAPYANIKETEKSFKVFEDVLKVNGLNVEFGNRPKDLYFYFRDALEGHRFDGISGAVQLFCEKLLVEWFNNCMEHAGLDTVCFAGGVAQNIKACMHVTEETNLRRLSVSPAAGDTSLCIGACYRSMWDYVQRTDGVDYDVVKPLPDMYLGPEFTNADIEKALNQDGAYQKYHVSTGCGAKKVATMLSEGKIVARCSGRMEFGLRALGNRSILGDPRYPEVVEKINRAIKFRDFWMPFTPSVLAERAKDYIVNPKQLESPFMTMAFHSTELARKELIAALHPADYTMRPQILERDKNPEYYEIIKAFESLTGVGGILNTSFNLHGLPIVLGPKEALYTFENSSLDALVMNDVLVLKKD